MNVFCFGLSYRTAGVDIRERFAVTEGELPQVIGAMGALPGIAESVILSTCNRVEFYAACAETGAALDAVREYLGQRTGIAPAGLNGSAKDIFPASALPAGVTQPFYTLDGAASINHLFRVVSGLDSMVIGETEILGQVKKAYAAASAVGATSRHLNKLFQRAFNVAKEVRTKTCITRGPGSVGSVAVDLAEKIFGKLTECSDEWDRRLQETDILISSTAAPHAVVTREKLAPVMHGRPARPLFVIDLAVPRDVEPEVNNLDGVYLYDIDSLQAIAQQGIETRRKEIVVCETLIGRHVTEFVQWLGADPAARPVSLREPREEA